MIRTAIAAVAASALFAWSSSALGQAPPARPDAPTGGILDNRVDTLLREWAERTSKIRSLYAEFTRTTFEPAFKTKETDEGSARYLHPRRARLDIVSPPDRAESHVLTGTGELWIYLPPHKKIKVFKLPPEAKENDPQKDGPLPFLFGSRPEEAKARYRFDILDENPKNIHVKVFPKLVDDQKNFVWCELWLNKENFLPDKIRIREGNDTELTFTFKGIWTNIPIEPSDFVCRRIKDWTVEVQQFKDDDRSTR